MENSDEDDDPGRRCCLEPERRRSLGPGPSGWLSGCPPLWRAKFSQRVSLLGAGAEAGHGFPGLFAAPVVLDTFYSPSSGSTRHARARIAQQRGLKANPDRQAAGKLRFACCQIGAASAECSRRLISIFAMNAAARASASGSRGGRGLSFQFHALLLGLCCTIRGTMISAARAGFARFGRGW